MNMRVLIPSDISEVGKQYLRDKGYEIKMGSDTDEATIIAEVQNCDGLLARNEAITREILQKAGPRLKVIGKHGVGLDKIDLSAAEDQGIWVTNGPYSNTVAVAEHTVMLILACAKKLVFFDRAIRSANYDIRNQVKGMDLEGKTLCIIGLGKIGLLVAKKCALAFDMKIVGYDPYAKAAILPDYVSLCSSIEEAMENADFVSLHLPATKDNDAFFDKNYFSKMKKTAYFINAARGGLVNEADLYQALYHNIIAGAGLDVFYTEPPSVENLLFTLPNIIVTPHNAALTIETTDRMGLHAALGINSVLSGKKPDWPAVSPKEPRINLE